MIDYEEVRQIFELEGARAGINMERYKGDPCTYKYVATRRLFSLFMRGAEIGHSLTVMTPQQFEDAAFERFGTIQNNVQVMFKVRKIK